ncbi:hypothetical protein WMO66_00605, partial [Faecousia sp. CLA-AA-H192]
ENAVEQAGLADIRLADDANLRALCGRRCQPITYQPAWRSLTAATDAIGFYVFIDSRYKSAVQRRERHAAPLQRTFVC